VLLKILEAFVIEPLFVPVVLDEEFVKGAFPLSWKEFAFDTRHDPVADYNKTGGVSFDGMTFGTSRMS
jgi:hypothetical protein